MSLAFLKQHWRIIQVSELYSGMESQKSWYQRPLFRSLSSILPIPSPRWPQEHTSYGVLASLSISGFTLLKAQPAYLLLPSMECFFLLSKELCYVAATCAFLADKNVVLCLYLCPRSSLTKTHYSLVSRGSTMFVDLYTGRLTGHSEKR